MERNTVKCCNCNWQGQEEDLEHFLDEKEYKEYKEKEPNGTEPIGCFEYKGCPNCKTDEYLMDL